MYYRDRILLLDFIGWGAIAICIGLFLLGTVSPLAPDYSWNLRRDHFFIVLFILFSMYLMFKGDLPIALIWPLTAAGTWIGFIPSMKFMEEVHPYPFFSPVPFPFGVAFYIGVLALILFGGYGLNFWIWKRN